MYREDIGQKGGSATLSFDIGRPRVPNEPATPLALLGDICGVGVIVERIGNPSNTVPGFAVSGDQT
jgi:hypothetical protein